MQKKSEYRVRFQLDKWDIFKESIEYVGHGVNEDKKNPAQSKSDIIND